MSTPGGLVDKQELIDAQLDTAHLGRVVNSKDASGAPISTSTNRTGGVNKTLDALEGEYLEAIQGAGGVSVGTWAAGVTTFTKYNEYAVFNGIPYKPRTTTTLPYVAQGADPTTAPDEANVQPYQEITEAQVVALVEEAIPDYTDIVYTASGGNSAFENMIDGIPITASVGDTCSTGGTSWRKVSDNGGANDFIRLSDFEPLDFGFIYNDPIAAASNYSALVLMGSIGGKVKINDSCYLEAGEGVISKGLFIDMVNGKLITWVNSDAKTAYYLADDSYWIEKGTSHLLASGESMRYHYNASDDIYIPLYQMKHVSMDGDIYSEIKTTNTLNPADPLTKKFGFGFVDMDFIKLRNRDKNFFTAQSNPFTIASFTNFDLYNWGRVCVSMGIENTHPHYNNIKESMRQVVMEHVKAENPDDKFGDETGGTYHALMLNEAKVTHYNHIVVNGMQTKNNTACYDVYIGGDEFYSNNVRCTNIYAFNRVAQASESNTCLKIKNADICEVDHRVFDYEDTYTSRMLANEGVDFQSSYAEWMTYTGSIDAERFSITNSKLHALKLNSDVIPSRQIKNFILDNVQLTSPGSEKASVLVVYWDDTNNAANRTVRMINSRVYAPNAEVTELLDLSIGNQRGGHNVILQGNSIIAKDLIEVKLVGRVPGEPIKDVRVDELVIDNNIQVSGSYTNILPANNAPSFTNVTLGGSKKLNAWSGSITELPFIPTASGAITAHHKVTCRSGVQELFLARYLSAVGTFYTTKFFYAEGKIKDESGVHDFWCEWRIDSFNATTGEVTFSIRQTNGSLLQLVWDGVGTVQTLGANSTHPTLSITMERTTGYAGINFNVGGSGGRCEIEYNITSV